MSLTYASISKNLFPEVADMKWQIFQDKKVDSLDTHTRTHTRTNKDNLDFSTYYGAQTPLFVFEFDSHLVLLRLLLCNIF